MADDTTQINYLTQEEVDALREEFGVTRPLTGDRYVGVNPNTGERGIFLFNPQGGWMDMTKAAGPRTTYEDGTPIQGFNYQAAGRNPNWVSRLYDVFRMVGDYGVSASGRSSMEGGFDKSLFPKLEIDWRNDPAFSGYAHSLAMSDMSLNEIYNALQNYGKTPVASAVNSTTSTPSTVSGTNNVRLFPKHYLNNFVSNRGAFPSQAPSTLSRSLAPSLPTPFSTGLEAPTSTSITTPQGTDYVKLLRSFLTAGLFKDYI